MVRFVLLIGVTATRAETKNIGKFNILYLVFYTRGTKGTYIMSTFGLMPKHYVNMHTYYTRYVCRWSLQGDILLELATCLRGNRDYVPVRGEALLQYTPISINSYVMVVSFVQ